MQKGNPKAYVLTWRQRSFFFFFLKGGVSEGTQQATKDLL